MAAPRRGGRSASRSGKPTDLFEYLCQDEAGAGLQGATLEQSRQIAGQASGFADEVAAQAGPGVDGGQADVAGDAEQGIIVGKQPVEAIGGDGEGCGVEASPLRPMVSTDCFQTTILPCA